MVAALSHVSCWLHRVQNRYLWKRYMHEKKLVSMATGEGGVNEKWLWHGTSRVDPFDICRHMDGVDFRMVGGPCRDAASPVRVSNAMGGCVSTSLSCLLVCVRVCACLAVWLCLWDFAWCGRQSDGGFYGRGAYFAERAAYSHTSYRHKSGRGRYQLILARVLCGKGKEMGTTTDRSLVKAPPGYNSVHGYGATRSSMWVVYDRAQSYPAFVVTYKI